MNVDTNLIAMAQSVAPYVLEVRQELHQIPETRYETAETRKFIRTAASELLFPMDQGRTAVRESKGGIVFDLTVKESPERILFRADFDALPVKEATGLPFASKTDGKMHACGHDIHTAMLLGALKCIADGKVTPKHNLRFVFQDAEENPGTAPEPMSGGDMLVRDGVCDGVSAAYALHIWALGEKRAFLSRPGGMLGNSGRIKFVIRSSGGHVMNPAGGTNVLRVVQAVMNRLDSFVARNFTPTEPATLEPVILNSGKASNVMPSEAEVWYGFRTLLPKNGHIAATQKVVGEVKAVVEGMGATLAEVNPIYGHPALINDEVTVAKTSDLLRSAGMTVGKIDPMLGGEDFAHYLYKVPGAMYMLGAKQEEGGDHHSPTFNPDESVFWQGVLFWLLLATQ